MTFNASAKQQTPVIGKVDVGAEVEKAVREFGEISANPAFSLVDPEQYLIWLAGRIRRQLGGPRILLYEAVADDVETRIQSGQQKYGRRLETHNGRNALFDAYQELLDLLNYLKQSELEQR